MKNSKDFNVLSFVIFFFCILSWNFSLAKKETKKTIPLVQTTKEYKVGKGTHKGYLVYKKGIGSQAPGVLLLPEFWGLNSDMKSKADKLASWGYVVMVADLYGEGRSTTSPDEAKRWLTAFESENQKIVYKTFMASFITLRDYEKTAPGKIAIVGYSYGGGLATEMARRGFDFKAVVNIHGAVGSKRKAKPGFVKAPILWIRAEHDAYVDSEMVEKFHSEMNKAKADLKVVTMKDAYHSFTNPKASQIGKAHQLPFMYDEKLTAQTNLQMKTYLDKKLR